LGNPDTGIPMPVEHTKPVTNMSKLVRIFSRVILV
jgi:hypothetical protein